jgi:hypothetical protein
MLFENFTPSLAREMSAAPMSRSIYGVSPSPGSICLCGDARGIVVVIRAGVNHVSVIFVNVIVGGSVFVGGMRVGVILVM